MRKSIACFGIGRALGLVAVGLAATFGCGLVSSDITNVATLTFDLPSKTYSFDTSNPMWTAPPGNFPAVSCGAGGLLADCCQPPTGAVDCVATPLVCDNGTCALQFSFSTVQLVDLKSEVPSLSALNNQSLADIYVSQLHASVQSTLNVPLPPVELFIAPQSVTSPDDPAAQKFGTVPSSPAMANTESDVALEADSETVFSGYAQNFGTPFNFIARTTVVVDSGNPAPSGKVDITVTGQVSAKPSL